MQLSWRQFTPRILQGSAQIYRSVWWWRFLLNSMLQVIPDMSSNVHVLGFSSECVRRAWMRDGDQTGWLRTCKIRVISTRYVYRRLSYLVYFAYGSCAWTFTFLFIEQGSYQAKCTRPIPLQTIRQIEHSFLDMQDAGIHEVLSISLISFCMIQLKTNLIRLRNVLTVIQNPVV